MTLSTTHVITTFIVWGKRQSCVCVCVLFFPSPLNTPTDVLTYQYLPSFLL